jgi:DNA-binding transcriptional regulator/RsmH inhibitor MraZ
LPLWIRRSKIYTQTRIASACEIVDIGRWLPQAWPGKIDDGKLLLPVELNSSLVSRSAYILGTVSGYFIICPDEFRDRQDRSRKCVSFPRTRDRQPHVYGIGMTELTEDGCLTLPREIRNAPAFEDSEVVFAERHGFVEIWSMAAWNSGTDLWRKRTGG